MNEDNLRYPIGKFIKPAIFTDEIISEWIGTNRRISSKIGK